MWIMWLYLDLLAAESLVVFVSSIFPNFVISLALTAFANGLWMSVGGFLVPTTILNVFWKYVFHYIDYQVILCSFIHYMLPNADTISRRTSSKGWWLMNSQIVFMTVIAAVIVCLRPNLHPNARLLEQVSWESMTTRLTEMECGLAFLWQSFSAIEPWDGLPLRLGDSHLLGLFWEGLDLLWEDILQHPVLKLVNIYHLSRAWVFTSSFNAGEICFDLFTRFSFLL